MTLYYTIAESLRVDYNELAARIITEPRLKRYGSLNPPDVEETLARYLWNVALSQALYPPLHGFEVAFRNRVHSALTRALRDERWMIQLPQLPEKTEGGQLIGLRKKEKDQVNRALGLLGRSQKAPNVGEVVATLTLGFWVSLFGMPYEQCLWRGHALREVFQHAPRPELACHKLRAKLFRVRYLRNRVFHHDSIWHWRELSRTHQELNEMLAWLSPDWGRALAPYDRFRQVHRAGYQPYLDKLRTM